MPRWPRLVRKALDISVNPPYDEITELMHVMLKTENIER